MVVHTSIKKIIERVAEKYGISYHVAYTMWKSQFDCIAEEVAKADHTNINTFPLCYVRNMGVFFVSRFKVRYYTNLANKIKRIKAERYGLDVHSGLKGQTEDQAEPGNSGDPGVQEDNEGLRS